MKMNKTIKIVLSCAVILLFIGGSIAAAEQTKFGDKAHTAAIQKGPGQIMLPGGHIINESDQEKNVIKRGTVNFKLPKTDSMKEHMNAINNLSRYLKKLLNFTPDEVVSVGCDADNCTYEVIKMNKPSASPVPSTYQGWVEDAIYWNWGGTQTYFGAWHVPNAPPNQSAQTAFYFIDLENTFASYILQPVLGWNWRDGNQWEIASVAGGGSNYNYGPFRLVNIGDSITGTVSHDIVAGVWNIDTYDITTSSDSLLISPVSDSFIRNHVTLEAYNLNTCNQFPGRADFYNLYIYGQTPSWGVEQRQSGCGLSVNIVSPSEVILNTGN